MVLATCFENEHSHARVRHWQRHQITQRLGEELVQCMECFALLETLDVQEFGLAYLCLQVELATPSSGDGQVTGVARAERACRHNCRAECLRLLLLSASETLFSLC